MVGTPGAWCGTKCIPYWLDSGNLGGMVRNLLDQCGTECIPYWLDSADLGGLVRTLLY